MTNDIPLWSPRDACCPQCVNYQRPYPLWGVPAGCRVLSDPEPGTTITYCLAYTPRLGRQDATCSETDPHPLAGAAQAALGAASTVRGTSGMGVKVLPDNNCFAGTLRAAADLHTRSLFEKTEAK